MTAGTSLGNLTVGIGVDTSLLVTGLNQAKGLLGGFGGAAAGALIGAGAAVAGLGIKAIEMAGNFSAGLTSLVTGAGEAQSNLGMVSAGMLNMAVSTGTSTQSLVQGMYMIESAGYHGATGLAILQAAAEGAKVGNASLADVANGVTTAMTDYSKSGLTAAQATNILIAAVAAGKTHMQDMATAMSTILPTSAAVGVSFTDVSGAMATMTGEGTDAASAATYLRQLLLALEAPAAAGAKALASVGLTTQQVSDEMKISLPDTLTMITDAVGKKFPVGSAAYVEAIKAISGGSKTMQGILELTGTHLATFQQNVQGVTDAANKGGTAIKGWNLVTQDFNFKMDKGREMLETFGIKIGTALMPKVGDFVVALEGKLLPLLGKFSIWIESTALPDLLKFGNWFESTAVPALQHFGDAVEKNILPPVESLLTNVETAVGDFANWATQSGAANDAMNLLGGSIAFAANTLGMLVGWVGDFFSGLQSGNPLAQILVGAMTSLGTAIGLIKLEEFAAGLYNSFQKMQQGAGVVANLATKALPDLSTALGWTKTAADGAATSTTTIGTSASAAATTTTAATTTMESDLASVGTAAETSATEVETIGASVTTAETDVALASGSMETSIAGVGTAAVATGGEITAVGAESVAAGAVVDTAAAGMTVAMGIATAGISLLIGGLVMLVASSMSSITNDINQMSQKTKAAYDALGTSAADNSAKAQAKAIEAAGATYVHWKGTYDSIKVASYDARAQQVLDQQAIADAAEKAAAAADNAWVQASQGGDLATLYHDAGFTDAQISKMMGYTYRSTSTQSSSTTGQHASGGTMAPGEYGVIGDQGPEVVQAGMRGLSILDTPSSASLLNGLSQPRATAMSGGSGGYGGGTTVHMHLHLNDQEIANAVFAPGVLVQHASSIGHAVVSQMRSRTGARV